MLDDLSAAHERIDQWSSAMTERVGRATELANRTGAMTGAAKDRDGLVEVTVDSIGAVSHLWLSERTRQQPAATTAQLILTTMRAAQAQLAQRITAETVAAYGPDSPATAAIVAS